ncbi:hypothetical protein Tco_1029344 [Tanacetum coccineum]|uniref:Gag protein n=1 Tax=Tanacetum coccineum TaxID=301880 RepID=A0ABQ5G4Q3_9ASTR
MHNNIMAAGSKDRPPMLGPGRYSQWRSRFLRYLDTKSNGEYLRKCIFEGPYTPTNVLIAAVEAVEKSKEMWTAIERLQQGESLNVQDVKTNLLLGNLGSFTSRVNVQFLQQLQPEWPRFVTVVKQRQEIDTVSYHKLFDVLKQFQNEIAKPVTPQSESVYEEDRDPEQARRDKDMKKNLALLAKAVWKSKDDDSCWELMESEAVLGSSKPKRVKDYAYHKEKMMMCKQAEQGVPLQAEQADWLEDTDEEIDEQELEAHYSYMAKIQDGLT